MKAAQGIVDATTIAKQSFDWLIAYYGLDKAGRDTADAALKKW